MLECLQWQHLQPQLSVKVSLPGKSDRLCPGRGIHFHQLTPSLLSWEASGAAQAWNHAPYPGGRGTSPRALFSSAPGRQAWWSCSGCGQAPSNFVVNVLSDIVIFLICYGLILLL